MRLRSDGGPSSHYAVATVMWIAALLAAGAGLRLLTWSVVRHAAPRSGARPSAADDASAVLAEFGPPESDRTTDLGGHDGGMGLRLFTYASRHVRVVFMARIAGSPPHSVWKLAGVLDPDTNHLLDGVEAVERLKSRR